VSTVALGDIANWGSGGTPLRSVREYFGEGLPWLSIADLNDGLVDDAKESLTPLGIEHSSAKPVPPGTLLVAMYGSIGKLGIAARELCTSQAIAFAIPDTRRVDTRYLFHFLLSERPRLQSRGRGGTQSNIGQGDLKAWRIPLPPLPEQRRIAATLDKADALRAKRRAALAKLDELTQSIFLDMFGDPQVNPKKWPVGTLGEFISAGPQNGLYKPASYYGSGNPILRIDGFYDGVVTGLDSLKRVRVSGEEVARYGLKPRDIVINRVNSREYLGKSALIPDLSEPTVFESNMMRFEVDHGRLHPVYVIHLLQTNQVRAHILQSAKDAVNQSSINQQDVKRIPIVLPPTSLQELFARRVGSSQNIARTLRSSAAEFEALFASLQHRTFQGEL